MLSKIVRRNGTEIENIQSVTYSETVNAGESLRPGCVSSSYINVRVYGTNSDAPASGEALTYYQVDPDGNDTLIGVFYAEPSVPSIGMYSFVAYDAVRKLDTDFSAKLESMQSSFPMTVYDLVSEACSVAGVTLGSASWPMSTMQVNACYADNLTCRNILQYAAEIACRFVRCDVNGNVLFDWYTVNSKWSVYPGGSDANKVAYRLGGLSYDGNNVQSIDSVVIKSVGEYGTQYTYPEYNPDISAVDPDSDGNVTMLNVTVTDSGDGHLTIIAKADDPNRDGNVTIEDGAAAENSLTIANNLLLTDAAEATYVSVAQNILSVMIDLPIYRFAEIQLFPNENPFRSGEFVSVTDAQGISFITPVFTMTLSSSGATLRSSGTNVYRPSETTTTEKEIASQTNELVRINKLKVDWAEIGTAVIDTLEAHGIDADWITAHSISVDKLTGSIIDQGNAGWELNLTNGTLTIGNIAAENITAGFLDVARIRADSIDVAKLTGAITNGDWKVDLLNETFTVGDLSADKITTGALTVKDANDSVLFKADVSSKSVKIGGWTVDSNGYLVPDGFVYDANIYAGSYAGMQQVLWQGVNGNALVSEPDRMTFVDGITDNFYPTWTKTYGEITGLSVPRVIWENSDPSQGMAAQNLTLKTPATADDPVTDMSLFNFFYVEVAWTTSTPTRRAGTWVYVGDNETIVACPSVSSTAASALTYVYRYVTIDKSNNTISIANGQRANTSGITASNNYAVPTKILAMKV